MRTPAATTAHPRGHRWRIASWWFAAASLALPVVAYLLQKRALDAAMHTHHGYVCGLPYLAALLSSVSAAVALSLAAMLFGALAWRRLPRPRPVARTLEVAGVGIAFWLLALLAAAASVVY